MPKITIYTEQFPPYNFSNKGQLQGINLDIVRELCIRANVECTFELLPWTRAYKQTQSEQFAGLVSTARIDERESSFLWVGPLVSSHTYFYRLATNKHITATNLKDVSKYNLGIAHGSVYEQLVIDAGFVENKNLLKYTHHYEYVNLFFKNKLDLLLGSEMSLNHQLQQYGYSIKDVVKLVELPVSELNGNYLAFNTTMPIELVERFRLALTELNKNDFKEYKARYSGMF